MSIRFARNAALVLSLFLLAVSAFLLESAADKGNSLTKTKTPKNLHVRVTISRETTYITEPLRPDGYPDYLAALNQRLSKGVTPENNAAVPFWKAMGPKAITKDHRERYFQMLGIAPLPEKGDYFVTTEDWIEHYVIATFPQSFEACDWRIKANEQMLMLIKRPWTKKEFPFWAEWLEKNEKPLKLLAEACQRPRRYEPLMASGKGLLINVLPPTFQGSRGCARALAMRSMLRLGEGNVDAAWSDLMNCHRWARLTDQSVFLVDGLAVVVIETIAQDGDCAVAQHGKLTASQLIKMRDELDQLPSVWHMNDRIENAERFTLLDAALTIAREGAAVVENETVAYDWRGRSGKYHLDLLLNPFLKNDVSWDIAAITVNSWFDRFAAVGRLPTHTERLREGDKISREIRAMAEKMRDPIVVDRGGPVSLRKAVSARVGQIVVAMLAPAYLCAIELEDIATMQSELTKLAFALAAYHADHGTYPDKLNELTPNYIKQVPKDIFNNNGDLHYSRQNDGYLLYSVGRNGKDNGGETADEIGQTNWNGGDDLTVRVLPDAK